MKKLQFHVICNKPWYNILYNDINSFIKDILNAIRSLVNMDIVVQQIDVIDNGERFVFWDSEDLEQVYKELEYVITAKSIEEKIERIFQPIVQPNYNVIKI